MDSTSSELPPYAMPVDFSSMVGTTPYDIIAAQFASRINSNENGYCTPTSLWSSPQSPTSSIDHSKADDSHDDAHSPTSGSEESSKTAQKGRRGNRYKNCSESVISKRRAQNRANQRAYRKRKESRLEELQAQIQDMSQKNDALCCAYRLLANECCRLRASQQMSAVAGQGAPAWDLMSNTTSNNGAGSLALDMSALDVYRIAPPPVSTSSPVPESYLDYPGSPEKLWSPY